MKTSEKIQFLRKDKGYTQEELAELCHVSRQSISKWEADIALPEVDKLMILSNLFQVSIDALLKDERTVDGIKGVHFCGTNALEKKQEEIFEGILIKESVSDDSILDFLTINKLELWNTGGHPKYWTVLYFTSAEKDLPNKLSQAMLADPVTDENWFVDFKAGNIKYIVFKDKILNYTIGNQAEKEQVCEECRRLGISDEQMQWPE